MHAWRGGWGTDKSLDALLIILYLGLYRQTGKGRRARKFAQRSAVWLGRDRSRACPKGQEYKVPHESSRMAAAWGLTVWGAVGRRRGRLSVACSLDFEGPRKSSSFTFHSEGTWESGEVLNQRWGKIFLQL